MDFLELGLRCVSEVKEVFARGFVSAKEIEYKGGIDLVTSVDKEVEERVVRIISSSCEGHSIVAEESGLGYGARGSSLYCWIIDPLDGTTNFAHNLGHYALSIALERGGELVMGLVYNPSLDELFYAELGGGAYRSGKRIRVSSTVDLSRSLVATGFPYDVHENLDEYILEFRSVLGRVRGVRRFGVASLDLCYTACGSFDVFWERGLRAWDVAAGILIVEEAGGLVSDYRGSFYNYFEDDNILVSNGFVHDAMVGILGGI